MTRLLIALLLMCPAVTAQAFPWILPGEFKQRLRMSDLVVSGTIELTRTEHNVRVDKFEVMSNLASLRVDRVFKGAFRTQLNFRWYSFPATKNQRGTIYAGPPLAAFWAGERYLVFLKGSDSGWTVALPMFQMEVRLSTKPTMEFADLSQASEELGNEQIAQELESAALNLPAPSTETTGWAPVYFPWIYDLIGGCAKPFFRHYLSSPVPALRRAAANWIRLADERKPGCNSDYTDRIFADLLQRRSTH